MMTARILDAKREGEQAAAKLMSAPLEGLLFHEEMNVYPHGPFGTKPPDTFPRVVLCPLEIEVCIKIADMMRGNDRGAGYNDRDYGRPGERKERRDWNGKGGEVGFCKLDNIFPSLRTLYIPGTKVDCRLRSLRPADVKTSSNESGDLMLDVDYAPRSEREIAVYPLMVGSILKGEYRYAGYATFGELVRDSNIRLTWDGREVYVMTQRRLHKELPE